MTRPSNPRSLSRPLTPLQEKNYPLIDYTVSTSISKMV